MATSLKSDTDQEQTSQSQSQQQASANRVTCFVIVRYITNAERASFMDAIASIYPDGTTTERLPTPSTSSRAATEVRVPVGGGAICKVTVNIPSELDSQSLPRSDGASGNSNGGQPGAATIGQVVFHTADSEKCVKGCAAASDDENVNVNVNGKVVVVVLYRPCDGRDSEAADPEEALLDDVAWLYGRRRPLTKDMNDMPFILVDCSDGPIFRPEFRTGVKVTPLEMAFRLNVCKFIKWAPNSRVAMKRFVHAVFEEGLCGKDLYSTSDKIEYESLFSSEWSTLNITRIAPQTVRQLIELLHPPCLHSWKEGERRHKLEALALRSWVKVRNWPAVREVVLYNAVKRQEVNLSFLRLGSVPEQLQGISCVKLDLIENGIQELPQWLLQSRVGSVPLAGNPVVRPTPDLLNRGWEDVQYKTLFGDDPMESSIHKLILIGASAEKSSLLRAMKEGKTKVKVVGEGNRTVLVQEHKYCKLHRKSEEIWTVWELGHEGHWSSCYLPLLCSHSHFLIVFNALEALRQTQSILAFWLNQISLCRYGSSMYVRSHSGNAQVFFVATDCKGFPHAQKSKEIVASVMSTQRANIELGGFYSITLQDGKGLAWKESLDFPASTNSAVKGITDLLENFASNENAPVSPRWIALHNSLLKVKEDTIPWSRFVRLAHKYIRTKKQPDHIRRKELELCCNWLSDIGTIIHFRHPYFSQDQDITSLPPSCSLLNIVVLNPEWFQTVVSALNGDLPAGPHSIRAYTSLDNLVIPTSQRMPLLHSKLGLIMKLHHQYHYAFAALISPAHDQLETEVEYHWNHKGSPGRIIFSGVLVDFGYLPLESFGPMMSALCGSPDIATLLCWKRGVVLSRRFSPMGDFDSRTSSQRIPLEQYVLLRYIRDKKTKRTRIHVCMKTIDENGEQPLCWRDNLMTKVFILLNKTGKENNIQSIQSFPCPHCFSTLYRERSSVRDKSEQSQKIWHSFDDYSYSYFSQNEVVDALVKGQKCVKCPTPGCSESVELSDVAPALFNLGFPIITLHNSTEVAANSGASEASTSLNYCSFGGEKLYAVPLQSYTASEGTLSAAGVFLNEMVAWSGIPHHENVLRFFGACISGTTLYATFEFLLPAVTWIPTQTREIETTVPERLRLADILEMCHLPQKRDNPLSILELPTQMKENIIRDIACGLTHLHTQLPPTVHGDVCADNIAIAPLAQWPGIRAKIGPPRWAQVTKRTREPPPFLSPESAAESPSTQYSSEKADVWSFGCVVHQIFNPLAPNIELEPNPEYFVPLRSRRQSQLEPFSQQQQEPPVAQVPLFQLGLALATGAFLLRNKDIPSSPSQPQWARQLITACWTMDPVLRPSMKNLLDIMALCAPDQRG
ncbi:hypothetical protein Pelo_3623 [Pelomyxa schiedti]|nr:hypothetical protein Pelo_3623 [Pelomyxa schiedti]